MPGIELAAVAAAAIAATRWPALALIALFAVASVTRWSRDQGWVEPQPDAPGVTAIGALVGLVALALGVTVAGPWLEDLTERSVEWTQLATIRGNAQLLIFAATLVAAQAVAFELILRRWIVDRAIDRGVPGLVAVAVAALAEVAIASGNPAARVGAGLAGLGYGVLYLGAGRRLHAPLGARLAFELGALILVWGRWV